MLYNNMEKYERNWLFLPLRKARVTERKQKLSINYKLLNSYE